ncbi:zinc finger MYM-type protein 1-like [Diabrotica undecimpunctata]|uniref:zinc finger MYM-type protein 1-like n=1 Tax=Diabrotica undecimpunctata TaxID=50387 RepID=UPI003B63407E
MLNLSPEERFKTEVFYTIIDVLVANLKTRFTALKEIEMKFSFLWKYNEMDENTISESCVRFAEEYNSDVSRDLVDEMIYLKTVSKSNISDTSLKPAKLLNKLVSLNVTNLFPNVCIALRILCCLPVSVAQAERSFSVLSRIKNCLRSTMGQQRLSDLGLLSIESKLAKTLDFDHVIQNFADMKARKVML